jgi:hypothetical protein
MQPLERGRCAEDQRFGAREKLFRRIPRRSVGPRNEIDPSSIQCSFGKTVDSAPSVLRSRYATAADVLHPLCAGDGDVSEWVVFYLKVKQLPTGIPDGENRPHDFYPHHAPLETCYAHAVVACRRGDEGDGGYRQPSRPVKNSFRAKFAAALKPAFVFPWPISLIFEVKKQWARQKHLRRLNTAS